VSCFSFFRCLSHKFTADPVEGQESDDSDDGRAAVDVVADYADLKPKDELANLTQRLQRSQTQKSKPCPQDEKDRQEKAALVKKWRTVLDRQSAVKQEAEITLLIIPLREPSNASILLNQAVLESANARTLRHFGFQFNKEKRVCSLRGLTSYLEDNVSCRNFRCILVHGRDRKSFFSISSPR
jgi:hypothetical protein